MNATVVRYTVHTQHAEENAALIAAVFEALERRRPVGVSYTAMRAKDGVTFTHVASVDPTLPEHPLTTLAEFKAFVAGIRARCVEPPQQLESTVLGRYQG